jgi:outer membrane lipoprotein-sorting protein
MKSLLLVLASSLMFTACGNNTLSPAQQMYNPGYSQAYGQPGFANTPQQPALNNYAAAPTNNFAAAPQGMPQQMAPQQPTAPQSAPQTSAPSRPSGLVPAAAYRQYQPGMAAPATPATTSAPRTNAPAAVPQAPAAAPADQSTQWLAQANQAFNGLQTLQATISTFEKGNTTGTGQIRYTWKQPGQAKIDILKSSDSSRNGVKLAYTGNGQVQVRAGGILGLMSLTLPMTDSKVKSGRQYLLSQIDLTATVQRLTQPGLQAKAVGKMQMGGSEVVVLEITPQGHFDSRITKERLGLDMQTFLPRVHEMYEGNNLVYSAKLEQVQINPTLGPDAFKV